MKIPHLLLAGVLASAAALPLAGMAQQTPTDATAPAAARPNAGQHHRGMMAALQNVNLSDAQKTQIQGIMSAFRQAHPAGSPRDPQAMAQMRDQVMGVLTPAQQTQFKANIAKMRQQREADGQAGAAPSAPPQ